MDITDYEIQVLRLMALRFEYFAEDLIEQSELLI